MPSNTTALLLFAVLLALLPAPTYAFGAGAVPNFSYLNDKAFRHGDIEDALANLAKTVGHAAGGGGLLGFAQSVIKTASGGSKFNKGDINKVYFGNWLRDYSQAMDIAGLSKLTADTLVLVVSVLGFMTFGFATEEFQVTADRLGVYLPVEHIDNPKGYGEKEGDPRQFHPKLRPPVNPRELEIDERTGMKNYIASENQGWDTSTAHIRRVLRGCIEHGRRAGGRDGPDLYEAYRLLGTGLHTLEDLLAHSNWCELALRKMGHEQVFCHVGESVIINTPNGPAPPLVTGTFGSADFLHSLMGEATDHISQASVTDLTEKMNNASNNQDNTFGQLKDLLSKLPIGGKDDQMNEGADMQSKAKAYNFDPNNVAPPEVQAQLWEALKWRDGIYREILEKIEMIPGLSDLIDQLTDALNAYVYTILAPWLTPILQQATGVLGEGSKAVIDSDDQYEVFDNDRASDPSHSLLSKDHFALILNEPAGKIAQLVVENSVDLIVKSWFDNSNPDDVITEILEAFHHPYYATGRSRIQNNMFEGMEKWLGALGPSESQEILESLTKQSVRDGKNKRKGSDDQTESGGGGSGYGQGATGAAGGYGSTQGRNTYAPEGYDSSDRGSTYNQQEGQYRGSGVSGGNIRSSYRQETSSYSGRDEGYGGQSREEGYGSSRRTEYEDTPSRDDESQSYGRHRQDESSGYQPSYEQEQPSYGRSSRNDVSESYGRRQEAQPSYEQEQPSYGRSSYNDESESYGRRQETSSGYQPAYEQERQPTYGRSSENEYGREDSSYQRSEEPSYSSGRGGAGYGGGGDSYSRNQESSYEQPQRQEYERAEYGGGRGVASEGYGSRGGYGNEESSGYEPRSSGYGEQEESYGGERERGGGGEYGDSEETFGAERLNINEGRGGYGGESEYRDESEY
ncbi:hypothetical protein PLICRDRAFT_412726 [Plicaturopsis crispa FD-325 SS-3]|nr:hypothetical protein PLICRDRAFT_412726 [Plicaturopsis crispa FD-325 SS-3]